MSADNFGGVRKVRRRRRGSDSVAETLAEWKMANNQVDSAKDGLNQNQRVPSKGSKKGCMRGKGGPENPVCDYRGVRQRTWGRWVAEIREPINRSHKPSKGKRLWLGTFDSAVDAALAYDEASKTMYGPYARLNFPEHGTETEQLPITPSSITTTPTRTPDSATISSNFEVSPTGELKTNNSADIVREIKDVKCTPINHGNSLNDGDEDEELVILKEEMKEESTDITNFSDCDRFKEEDDYFRNLLDEKMFEIGPLREDGFHGQLDSSALRQEQSHDFGQLDNFALRQEGNCDSSQFDDSVLKQEWNYYSCQLDNSAPRQEGTCNSSQFGLSNNGMPSDLSYQLQNQDTELPWSSSHMEEEVDYSLNSSRPDSALDEQGDLWFPGSGFY